MRIVVWLLEVVDVLEVVEVGEKLSFEGCFAVVGCNCCEDCVPGV